ncbi:MAG TPA: hypothetical protein VGI86_21290 [Acidimicrobiia bacterium]
MDADPLTDEDHASMVRATDELTGRGWRRFSLNEALDQWSSFVENIERGYELDYDSYLNDLSIRAWPEDARAFVTPRVASSMDGRLAPLDVRFREATNQVPWRVWNDEWWGHRIPKLLVGELADDIARERR